MTSLVLDHSAFSRILDTHKLFEFAILKSLVRTYTYLFSSHSSLRRIIPLPSYSIFLYNYLPDIFQARQGS